MSTTDPYLGATITEWDMIGRIVGAAALSALIGFEREVKNKPATVKLHIIVGAGAATFVGVALLNTHKLAGWGWAVGDVNRVPAGVASGVGFLGAGTIFKIHDQVRGLTTAAGIWIVAAIGYAVAAGYWYLGILVTLLVLIVQFGVLFFLSPRFWKDVREKFRLTYEMDTSAKEFEEEWQTERRSMVSARSGGLGSSDNEDVEASVGRRGREESESGKPGILDHGDGE